MSRDRNRMPLRAAGGRESPQLERRPRRARAAPSRAIVRRRRVGAVGLLAAIGAIVLLVSGGGGSSHRARAERSTGAVAQAPRRAPARAGSARAQSPFSALRRETIAQGSLPQTHTFPSAASHRFRALMGALWQGVVAGSDAPALPAFFPKGAYEQLKAINAAGADWTNRLVHDYRLDIGAAHGLLAGNVQRARLIGVEVHASFGHWVPPGVCDNSIGYYEMPNARVIYSIGGRISSFGIASMISWRGVWYVVHLGAVLRASDTGVVDEPSSGRGSSAYSGTC